jgi:kelch-like protein 10
VKTHPYVRDSEACKPIVIETLKFLYDLDMDEEKEVDLNNPLAKPRVPHEILFVIGGWSGGSPTNMVETYDTRADRWIICDVIDGVGKTRMLAYTHRHCARAIHFRRLKTK